MPESARLIATPIRAAYNRARFLLQPFRAATMTLPRVVKQETIKSAKDGLDVRWMINPWSSMDASTLLPVAKE